jgi:hypothetical protein
LLEAKVRLQLSLDPKTAKRVEKFMLKAHHSAASSAALELVRMGLAVYELPDGKEEAARKEC